MSVFPLARALGYVDVDNVFMLGFSPGGMMTDLAIRDGAPVRAAAVIGGLSDLPGREANRPPMRRMWPDLWAPFGGATTDTSSRPAPSSLACVPTTDASSRATASSATRAWSAGSARFTPRRARAARPADAVAPRRRSGHGSCIPMGHGPIRGRVREG